MQNFMNIKPLVYLVWSWRSETIFWYQSVMLFQQFCLRIWACFKQIFTLLYS